MLGEYVVEVRDSNGKREEVTFADGDAFMEWCVDIYENGSEADETEIMLIIRLVGEDKSPCLVYSALDQKARLDWDELIGFLA